MEVNLFFFYVLGFFFCQPIAYIRFAVGRFGGLDCAGGSLVNVMHLRLLAADACAQLNLELKRPNLDLVAGAKFVFAGDLLIVDDRAVAAAQVADRRTALADRNQAVATTDHVAVGTQLALRLAA